MIENSIKTVTINNNEAPLTHRKAEKKGGKRIGYNYIILKSLKESRKNDVVKCFYIKGLANWGLCVIKEGTYGESMDRDGRDIKDRLKWQEQLHKELQYKVNMPKLLGSFEENGNYYLVMEHISGKPLHKMFKKKGISIRDHLYKGNRTAVHFLNHLIQLLNILTILHKHQIVHRDVTPNNFMITRWGKVVVIDMELSYSLKDNLPSPPFQLGTAGFMSPGQEAMKPPTIKDDIFAVGAIIFNALTRISANKLTRDSYEAIKQRIHFLIDDTQMAETILQCLHPEPDKRPSSTEIKKVVTQIKENIVSKNRRKVTPKSFYTNDEVMMILQETISVLGSPLLCDPEKGWFAEHLKNPSDDKSKINKTWYASFSNGAAGILYFLAKAKMAGMNISSTLVGMQLGLNLIRTKYFDRLSTIKPGLHLGSDGVAVALSTMLTSGIDGLDISIINHISPLLDKQTVGLGIMHGIAGQGIANLICKPFVESVKLEERLNTLAALIMERQENDGSWNLSGNKSNPRFTRGFANGAAGIIYFLLEFSAQRNDNKAKDAALRGLDWMISKAIYSKNSLEWKSSKGKDLIPWWSDGVTGIVLPFIKAYKLYGDERYKKVATLALQSTNSIIMDNSLSQGYGLAGLGETYLEAWDVFREEIWQQRASHILQVIMHLRQTDATRGSHWLVERERQPVANFMVGNAGILHFLLRFSFPDLIRYPILP